jgi:hypothetical protein
MATDEDRTMLHHSVDKEVSRAFTARCKTLGVTPSQMVRDIMKAFVKGDLRITPSPIQMELFGMEGDKK